MYINETYFLQFDGTFLRVFFLQSESSVLCAWTVSRTWWTGGERKAGSTFALTIVDLWNNRNCGWSCRCWSNCLTTIITEANIVTWDPRYPDGSTRVARVRTRHTSGGSRNKLESLYNSMIYFKVRLTLRVSLL